MADATAPPAGPPQLPNPFAPMAFLPPDIAFQTTIASYILVGSLAVFIWDILNNISGDYKLLFKHRIGLPTVAYFLSRAASLAFVLCSAIFETSPAGNCSVFEKALDAMYPIALPATSLLFFFRIRAVFDRERYIVGFFFFLWLCVLAGCLTVTTAIEGINIGPTQYCLNASIKDYVAAAGIIPLVHDTAVFVAISIRLVANSHVKFNMKDGFKVLIYGEYLPAFSRALLQDGQIYYLTTVTTNLLAVIMLYVPSVPVTYRTMFTVPNIMLTNVMACRVFRNIKFGLFRETAISSSKLYSKNSAGIPLSIRQAYPRPVHVGGDTTFGSTMSGVEVTKTIERDDHGYDASIDKSRI